MISTSQWNDLVKNAKISWREGFDLVSPIARSLYDVSNVSVKTSEHSQIDGPGFAKRKEEGSKYVVGSPKQGYSLKIGAFICKNVSKLCKLRETPNVKARAIRSETRKGTFNDYNQSILI